MTDEKKIHRIGPIENHTKVDVAKALEEQDGPPPETEVGALANHALDLIDRLDGNVEFARRTWAAAFEEAERLEHNRMLDMLDDAEATPPPA
jgi:hypothetical protein